MKFAVAVIVLATVLGIECSIVPLSYTAVSGPAVVAVPGGIYGPSIATIRGPAGYSVVAGPAAVAVAPAHVAVAPAHVAVAPAVVAPVVAAQGSYVAQTRGAVHVAPLEGHANSAASINLEPAPGTV